MLSKPYKLIHKVDINKYYVMELDGYNQYLAIESIFYLRNQPKAKPKEKTQGLKLLRFSAPVLALMASYTEVEELERTVLHGKEEIKYKKIDISAIRNWLNDIMQDSDELKDSTTLSISAPETYENDTVKALQMEGFEVFGVIQEGSRTDTVLMVKQNPLGIFRILELVLTGKEEKSLVTANTFTFNKEIAEKVIDTLDDFKPKKSNKKIEEELDKIEKEKEND